MAGYQAQYYGDPGPNGELAAKPGESQGGSSAEASPLGARLTPFQFSQMTRNRDPKQSLSAFGGAMPAYRAPGDNTAFRRPAAPAIPTKTEAEFLRLHQERLNARKLGGNPVVLNGRAGVMVPPQARPGVQSPVARPGLPGSSGDMAGLSAQAKPPMQGRSNSAAANSPGEAAPGVPPAQSPLSGQGYAYNDRGMQPIGQTKPGLASTSLASPVPMSPWPATRNSAPRRRPGVQGAAPRPGIQSAASGQPGISDLSPGAQVVYDANLATSGDRIAMGLAKQWEGEEAARERKGRMEEARISDVHAQAADRQVALFLQSIRPGMSPPEAVAAIQHFKNNLGPTPASGAQPAAPSFVGPPAPPVTGPPSRLTPEAMANEAPGVNEAFASGLQNEPPTLEDVVSKLSALKHRDIGNPGTPIGRWVSTNLQEKFGQDLPSAMTEPKRPKLSMYSTPKPLRVIGNMMENIDGLFGVPQMGYVSSPLSDPLTDYYRKIQMKDRLSRLMGHPEAQGADVSSNLVNVLTGLAPKPETDPQAGRPGSPGYAPAPRGPGGIGYRGTF